MLGLVLLSKTGINEEPLQIVTTIETMETWRTSVLLEGVRMWALDP